MEPIEIIVRIQILSDGRVVYLEKQNVDGEEVKAITDNNKVETPTFTARAYLRCLIWPIKMGDKPERSCVGCKIAGCPGKDRYKGEQIAV